MATSKKPKKTAAEAKKNTATNKKVDVEEVKVEKPAASSTKANINEMDFGEKLTWVFNNWRSIWDAFVLNLGTLILAWLIPVIAILLGSVLIATGGVGINNVTSSNVNSGDLAFGGVAIFGALLLLLGVIAFLILAPAYTIIVLESIRGRKIDFQEAWSKSLQFVWRYIGMSLLILLVVALPFLVSFILMFVLIGFLILPLAVIFAILVAFFTSLAPYLLVDKNLSISEALRQSYELVRQNWQWIAVVWLVGVVLNALSWFVSWVPVIGQLIQLAVSAVLLYVIAYIYVKQIVKS